MWGQIIMNRVEYLSNLDNSLKCLPEQERREAVEFYHSYFQDGYENGKTDEQIIAELGPVQKVAAKIISQSNFEAKSAASKEAFKDAKSSSAIFSGVKGVFLAIGAVLIGLPGAVIIGIPVLAVLFALLVTAVSVIFSFGVVMIVVPIALIAVAVACFVAVPVIGISGVGWGLICLGLALLFGIGFYLAIFWIFKGIAILVNYIMKSFANRRRRKAAAK
jgi:uncharacterized membrane protein